MNEAELSDEAIAAEWPEFEARLVGWWDEDFRVAREAEVRADASGTLLYLPFPYSSAGGSEAAFPEMYGWDTYFVNLALLAYGRSDRARGHILNQLFMIDRYGFVLNGNRSFYLGRSQPPLHADLILRYARATGDWELACRAYSSLKREMEGYWSAPHHFAPNGLRSNRDILEDTEPSEAELRQLPLIADLTAAMLAEAETGLDFCPNFEGDVRNWNPLITNCVLYRYLEVLAELSERVEDEAAAWRWRAAADELGRGIQRHCWDAEAGFYFDWNFAEGRRGSVYSLCGYLPLWCGLASPEQAKACVALLPRFAQRFGLSQTDREAPSPHARFAWTQWNYPAGWPPFQVLTPEALRRYGYEREARQCELSWLRGCLRHYRRTGRVFEKCNVVDGSLQLPKERQDEIPPLHGWSTASCLIAGRNLFGSRVATAGGELTG